MKFNLIATCNRFMEFNAARELENILYMIGDEEASAWESKVSGLILAKTSFNPHKAINKMRQLLREKPWEFHYLKRIIPIDRVVKTDLEAIKEVSLQLAKNIPSNSTYRITVEKRYTQLHRREIINYIAPHINVKVDLENPQYILLIEIVGNQTGISLLKSKEEILNVQKELTK